MNKGLIYVRLIGRVLCHTPMILGIAMISMLWAGVFIKYQQQADTDFRDESRNGHNLALLFEENALRSIGEVDKALFYLRRNIEARLGTVDFHRLVSNSDILSDLIIQVAVIDAAGIMRASSANAQPAKPLDLSDREHYRFHLNKTQDELFVSKPVIGRASGKWSVQLTRKFLDKDGVFAGVVVASLNPEHFTHFYKSIDLGPSGSISLVGFDGVVRASGGTGGEGRFKLGQDLSQTSLLEKVRELGHGTFVDRTAADPTGRLVTFRAIRGHPLAVSVSVTEEQIYAAARHELLRNAIIGGCLTLIILGVSIKGLRDQLRLSRAQRSLLRSRRRALKKSEQLRLTLENMTQGIILVTNDRRVPVINGQVIKLLGLPDEFLRNPPKFDDLVRHQEKNGEFRGASLPDGTSPLKFFTRREDSGAFATYERTRPDGTVLEVRSTALPDGGFVRTFTDITERRHAQAEVGRLASEDVLTGLPNRRLFQQELEKCAQIPGSSFGTEHQGFALLYLDLDHFKDVNDTLGHPVGDGLLQAVAQRLKQIVRNDNIAARLGGDEFAILIRSVISTEQPEAVAKRLVAALALPYQIFGHTITIGVSIGIALSPHDATDPDLLLKAADMALYAAKAAGRSTYKFFHGSMAEQVRVRREVEIDLRQAIDKQELELHYQPLLNLATHTISGFEALMRWRHPARGLVTPGDFIPIAEDTGLIVPLGAWAIRTACLEAMSWPGTCKISVNVSSIQFKSGSLVATVRDILAETGLTAGRLELEITETTLLQDSETTFGILRDLRDLGVKVSLDDFGTGYSSLSYLRTIPLNGVKIDRSFVKDLGKGPGGDVIISSVIDIAKTLAMTTTAEGVETAEQLNLLTNLGCHEAQGYLISKPIPGNHVLDFINSWKVDLVQAA